MTGSGRKAISDECVTGMSSNRGGCYGAQAGQEAVLLCGVFFQTA